MKTWVRQINTIRILWAKIQINASRDCRIAYLSTCVLGSLNNIYCADIKINVFFHILVTFKQWSRDGNLLSKYMLLVRDILITALLYATFICAYFMNDICLKSQFKVGTSLILGLMAQCNIGYVKICLGTLVASGEPSAVSVASLHINEDEACNHGALARLQR